MWAGEKKGRWGRKSYISSGKFFLIYLSLFEIRANHFIHWISSSLIFFLLLPHPAPPPPPPDPPTARAAPPAAAAPVRCARAAAHCGCCSCCAPAAARRCTCCCYARAVAATQAAARAVLLLACCRARCGCCSCRCASLPHTLPPEKKWQARQRRNLFNIFILVLSTFYVSNFNILSLQFQHFKRKY